MGRIEVRHVLNNDQYAIYNEGYLKNAGCITIDSAAFGGIYCSNSLSLFENVGSLEIRHYSLFATLACAGVRLVNGTFVNEINGHIFIHSSNRFGAGISSQSIFSNLGEINIQDLVNYGVNMLADGTISNEGILTIENVTVAGLNVLQTGTFFQTSTGTLFIDAVLADPLSFESATIIELNGEVDIQ